MLLALVVLPDGSFQDHCAALAGDHLLALAAGRLDLGTPCRADAHLYSFRTAAFLLSGLVLEDLKASGCGRGLRAPRHLDSSRSF